MSDLAINVDGLGKNYRLGQHQEAYRTLRETLVESCALPFRMIKGAIRRRRPAGAATADSFWALNDVSFQVRRGDIVGVIGRNGAGKSTLLKVLSGITEPTNGCAEIYGRIASLLEVGTGFHPELTGRENVYLNGAILGMKRDEIARKFHDIVAFAEVERFIDTPVKHYSSGMYLRLAFAVAAHLDPDILLIDEVLAVGDVRFQRKCLGKVSELSHSDGRTVLLVSHNMGAISSLCDRVLVLDQGCVVGMGETEAMISDYLRMNDERTQTTLEHRTDRRGDGRLRITGISILDRFGNAIEAGTTGADLIIGLTYKVQGLQKLNDVWLRLVIKDSFGVDLFKCANRYVGVRFDGVSDEGMICCRIPRLPIAEGEYILDLVCGVHEHDIVDAIDHAAKIQVNRGDFFGTQLYYHRPSMYVDQVWGIELSTPKPWTAPVPVLQTNNQSLV